MKTIKSILFIVLVTVLITSCSSNEVETEPVVTNKAENIHAPVTTDYTVNPPTESGEFTKFNFSIGKVVTGNNWDIAFRGTTIIFNGGTKVGLTDEPARTGNAAFSLQTGTFSEIVTAPSDSEFEQDKSGTLALPKSTWYSYNRQTHKISVVAGKILVIKTNNGHYAKMEILSYYKNNDSSKRENARYYTFNYVYNPNKGEKNFK